jgi:DNA helicase HerA-like ATPase
MTSYVVIIDHENKLRNYPEAIITHKSSLLQFQGHVQRFRKSSLFIDKKVTSTYLGKEIKQIKSRDVFVIDIAMLSELEQQAFVIGDVLKSIDEFYSTTETLDGNENHNTIGNQNRKRPKYVLIFIDEINRFLPKSRHAGRVSTVAEQIMKTVIVGRSRGTVLFSAQQFKSTVDYALHENTGMHITAKLDLSELSTVPYNIIDESTKMNIVRLNKGELVVIHSAFRHPIKITFPKASFKKP